MAADEDNFDIDIYGDGGDDYQEEAQGHDLAHQDHPQDMDGTSEMDGHPHEANNGERPTGLSSVANGNEDTHPLADVQKYNSDAFEANQIQQMQSLKRKEGADERPLDPGATAALFVSDLHWWITDDDIRGWANQCNCEDELKEITFHEHKVNGKSKGFVMLLAFCTKSAADISN